MEGQYYSFSGQAYVPVADMELSYLQDSLRVSKQTAQITQRHYLEGKLGEPVYKMMMTLLLKEQFVLNGELKTRIAELGKKFVFYAWDTPMRKFDRRRILYASKYIGRYEHYRDECIKLLAEAEAMSQERNENEKPIVKPVKKPTNVKATKKRATKRASTRGKEGK